MTDLCPCCSPPWAFNYNIGPAVYFGGAAGSGSSHVVRFEDKNGANVTTFYTHANTTQAMTCDPDGNLYVSDGTNIVALDPSGNTLWTAADGQVLRGLAADQFGHVYSCGESGLIKKWDAATGVQNVAGWPYSWGGSVNAICVDRSGNVYGCGGNGGGTKQVLSVDSSGALRWEAVLPTAGSTGRGIAINATNDELAVCNEHPTPGSKMAHTMNPANGAFVISRTRENSLFCAAYAPNNDQYFGGNVITGGFVILKNGVNEVSTSAFAVFGICCNRDSAAFFGPYRPGATYNAAKYQGWGRQMPVSSESIFSAEHITGRCGAF